MVVVGVGGGGVVVVVVGGIVVVVVVRWLETAFRVAVLRLRVFLELFILFSETGSEAALSGLARRRSARLRWRLAAGCVKFPAVFVVGV